jgi:hypothetical protein
VLEQTITGVPLWLLRDYLVELGGRVRDDETVVGNDWVARLARVADHEVGSLRVGRVQLHIRASQASLERLRPHLERKLLRAGG